MWANSLTVKGQQFSTYNCKDFYHLQSLISANDLENPNKAQHIMSKPGKQHWMPVTFDPLGPAALQMDMIV